MTARPPHWAICSGVGCAGAWASEDRPGTSAAGVGLSTIKRGWLQADAIRRAQTGSEASTNLRSMPAGYPIPSDMDTRDRVVADTHPFLTAKLDQPCRAVRPAAGVIPGVAGHRHLQ